MIYTNQITIFYWYYNFVTNRVGSSIWLAIDTMHSPTIQQTTIVFTTCCGRRRKKQETRNNVTMQKVGRPSYLMPSHWIWYLIDLSWPIEYWILYISVHQLVSQQHEGNVDFHELDYNPYPIISPRGDNIYLLALSPFYLYG